MDYEKKFSEFLKRMNKNKIDWEKKNSWEDQIENSINQSFLVKLINSTLISK